MMLAVHVAGGAVALLAGFPALLARKGSPLHRYAGYVFAGGMIVMAIGAMAVGVQRGKYGNLLAGPFVMYLVVTAVTTLAPSSPGVARLNAGLRRVALPLGLAFVAAGVYRLTMAAGSQGGVPARSIAAASFLNAAVMLLAWWGDVRVARHGAPRGAARVRRHLWRMCYAMFTASASFFLGQVQAIPQPLRIWPVLVALALLPLLLMFYYLWRHRGRRRRRTQPAVRLDPAAVAT